MDFVLITFTPAKPTQREARVEVRDRCLRLFNKGRLVPQSREAALHYLRIHQSILVG